MPSPFLLCVILAMLGLQVIDAMVYFRDYELSFQTVLTIARQTTDKLMNPGSWELMQVIFLKIFTKMQIFCVSSFILSTRLFQVQSYL